MYVIIFRTLYYHYKLLFTSSKSIYFLGNVMKICSNMFITSVSSVDETVKEISQLFIFINTQYFEILYFYMQYVMLANSTFYIFHLNFLIRSMYEN